MNKHILAGLLMGVLLWPVPRVWAQRADASVFQGVIIYSISYSTASEKVVPLHMWGDSCVVTYAPQGLHFRFVHNHQTPYTRLAQLWLVSDQKKLLWQYEDSDSIFWQTGSYKLLNLYGMSFFPQPDSLLGYHLQRLMMLKRAPSDALDKPLRVELWAAPRLAVSAGLFSPFTGTLWNIYGRKCRAAFLRYRVTWENETAMHWQATQVSAGAQVVIPPIPADAERVYSPFSVILY